MRRQFTFAHNLHKLLRITSENVRPLPPFHEEIFKLHFLLNQGRSIFLKETRLLGKMRHCFVI